MKIIILASSSLDRQELLRRVKIPFESISPNINEEQYKKIYYDPSKLVMELAKAKVLNVKQKLKRTDSNAIIIAADTIIEIEGKIIGKPDNKEQAFHILKSLMGKSHNLITGYAITELISSRLTLGVEKTVVQLSSLNDNEIELYLESNEWIGRAGAYSINNKAEFFINSIQGSYSNVVGLPLHKLFTILKEDYKLNLFEFYVP